MSLHWILRLFLDFFRIIAHIFRGYLHINRTIGSVMYHAHQDGNELIVFSVRRAWPLIPMKKQGITKGNEDLI